MVKDIDYIFDHMDFVFCLIKEDFFSENWLVLPRITFITEFPGSNVLLPPFLTGFQVADLLLATVNFEPCGSHLAQWSGTV